MLSRLGVSLSALGLVTGGLALGTPAQADVRVGVMTCDMDSGFGYVLGSSRDLHCTFVPAAGAAEHYAGTISKFGVDIGYVQNAVIVWTVVAPTVALPPGSLTGTYGGATASATIGVRVGASVLVEWLQRYGLAAASQHRGRYRSQCFGWLRIDEPDLSAQLAQRERTAGAEIAAGAGTGAATGSIDSDGQYYPAPCLGASPAHHSHKPPHFSSSCGTWSCRSGRQRCSIEPLNGR